MVAGSTENVVTHAGVFCTDRNIFLVDHSSDAVSSASSPVQSLRGHHPRDVPGGTKAG